MGKLQIRGGAGEVPALLPREIYTNGEKLFVGKLDGSGNSEIGGSNVQIVEWQQGEAKPVIDADIVIGDMAEGDKYLVLSSVYQEQTIAYVLPYQKYVQVAYELGALREAATAILETSEGIYVAVGSSLFKLNLNGSIDQNFVPPVVDDDILVLAEYSGKILVGGIFTDAIIRISSTGALDGTFIGPALVQYLTNTIDVRTILVDGSAIFIGGQFDGSIKKLHPDGSIDPLFGISITGYCSSLAKLNDSYIGGTNDSGNGFLVKFGVTGNIDATFNPDVDAPVESIIVESEAIYVGGYFTGFFRKLNLSGTNQNVALQTAINAPVSFLAKIGDVMLATDLSQALSHFNPETGLDVVFNVSDALSCGRVYSLGNKFAISLNASPYLIIVDTNGDPFTGGQYYPNSLLDILKAMSNDIISASGGLKGQLIDLSGNVEATEIDLGIGLGLTDCLVINKPGLYVIVQTEVGRIADIIYVDLPAGDYCEILIKVPQLAPPVNLITSEMLVTGLLANPNYELVNYPDAPIMPTFCFLGVDSSITGGDSETLPPSVTITYGLKESLQTGYEMMG